MEKEKGRIGWRSCLAIEDADAIGKRCINHLEMLR